MIPSLEILGLRESVAHLLKDDVHEPTQDYLAWSVLAAGDILDIAAVEADAGLVLFYRVVEPEPLRLALCAVDIASGVETTLREARTRSEDGRDFIPALIWLGPSALAAAR